VQRVEQFKENLLRNGVDKTEAEKRSQDEIWAEIEAHVRQVTSDAVDEGLGVERK
jgi:hypothetical protein